MFKSSVFILLTAAVSLQSLSANDMTQGKELWLFGGGVPVCSSVEPANCIASQRQQAEQYFQQQQAVREKSFLVTAEALHTLQQSTLWPEPAKRRQQLNPHLYPTLQALNGQLLTENQWHSLLEPLDLNGDEQSLLDDWFEQRPVLAEGSTARMQVFFAGSEPYVQQMFQSFIESARTRAALRRDIALSDQPKPRLLLITASSYNVFEWVDYYQQLFDAAGAETVWLPIEPALVQDGRCEQLDQQRLRWNGQYQRAARYPELAAYQQRLCQQPAELLSLMQSADAIFINGGDQSLTIRSLQLADGSWTALAKLLHQRLDEGVPLGGTSAGTAVQAGADGSTIPMISGGGTETALLHGSLATDAERPLCGLFNACNPQLQQSRLTYKADGGLRSFTLGVTDTHFRERAREGRLLRLVLDTQSPAGFGVDEDTVLRANFVQPQQVHLSVQGRAGVWILERQQAQLQAQSHGWQTQGLAASRLLAGDTAIQNSKGLQVTLQCSPTAMVPAAQVDPVTYQSKPHWHWLFADSKVQACQRQDGNWRYAKLPLGIKVTYAAE